MDFDKIWTDMQAEKGDLESSIRKWDYIYQKVFFESSIEISKYLKILWNSLP